MRYRLLGLAAFFLVIATLACGGGGEETPPPPTETPPPPTEMPTPTQPPSDETATLILENESGETICFVLVSLATKDEWGDDWLGDAEVIEPGNTRKFDVPVGIYDLEARDCDDNVLVTEWDVELDGTVEWTISDIVPSGDSAGLDIMLEPNFGMVELGSGFTPDPQTVALVSGGGVDVGALGLGADCGGYASNAPDYRIDLSDDTDALRIFFVAEADEDATLIINDPYGNWFCDDDFSGFDPLVELQNVESGQYDVWVGSYSADEYIAGTLYITEMDYDPDNFPGVSFEGSAGLDTSLEPNFGMVELLSGFEPDPQTVALLSGGEVDVYALGLDGECGGYASSAPDFRISMLDDGGVLRIFFVASEGEDATLFVNDPYGNWLCNDDFWGLDPLVEFQSAESGQYDVWVGSYSPDEFIVGTLYITEMDYDPGNLP
ncbi:MAG: hypothetical protein SXV54_18420 [Chloroflexota bacterium]|nr:hypothetical protein [Chloroflexota bacterium]